MGVLSIARMVYSCRLNWRNVGVNLMHQHPNFLLCLHLVEIISLHLVEIISFWHERRGQVAHGWLKLKRLTLLEGRGEVLILVSLNSKSDGRLWKVVSVGWFKIAIVRGYLGSVMISICEKLPWSGMELLCRSTCATFMKRGWVSYCRGLLEFDCSRGRMALLILRLSLEPLIFLDCVSTEFEYGQTFIYLGGCSYRLVLIII